MQLRTFAFAIFTVALLIFSAGCTQNQQNPGPMPIPKQNQSGTPPAQTGGTYAAPSFDPDLVVTTLHFSSNEELQAFAKKYSGTSNNYYGGYYRGGVMMESAISSQAPAPTGSAAALDKATVNSGLGYSKTNVQVEGVDEADLLKTDGKYIYTVSNNMLYIVNAAPGKDAEVVSTIKFTDEYSTGNSAQSGTGASGQSGSSSGSGATAQSGSGSSSGSAGIVAAPPDAKIAAMPCYGCGSSYGYQPQELFISNNKLAVFGDYSNALFFEKIDFTPRYGMSFLRIYDVSNAANPKLEKEYKFEGRYFRGRMKGDYMYLLTSSAPQYRDYPTPMIMEGTAKRPIPATDVYYYNVPYQNPVFVNIHAVNLAGASHEVSSKSVVVEQSQALYMSENSIYLTYTDTINEWELQQQITQQLLSERISLSKMDSQIIDAISKADELVLTKYEKDQKISNIYSIYLAAMPQKWVEQFYGDVQARLEEKINSYKYFEFTVINKITIDGGKITPSANGKVPGHILNQFSMDENNGVFRIATNLPARWSNYGQQTAKPSNNIYTLDANLNVMGQIDGIAPDEQIYSTRFMGPRLYMVTFRQVDPFFVFDLSNPSSPKELGKLKIPGFSRYLHPYDENTIIGIGQDATSNGRTTGLKISLFDVSDVSKPKEVAKYVTDERYATSSALYEHRAFLFSKEKSLLVVPAVNNGNSYWNGVQYKDDQYNGAFVFRIDKSQVTLRGLIDHSQAAGDNYWQPVVQRSLYIDDMLYTKSERLIRVNALDTLTAVNSVWLNATTSGIPVY